jgi:UDPglucose 6-dehydrogenase
MAVIAAKCPHDIRVTVVDINAARIAAWNSDDLPIYEPGLDEVVRGRAAATCSSRPTFAGGIRDADIIFVSVNTPTKTFGEGAGAADLQYWEKTARQILAHSTRDKIVVEKSTLPVRTAEAMERILNSNGKRPALRGAVEPRVPRRGHGGRDLENARPRADRRHETPEGRRGAARGRHLRHWVPRERIIDHEPLERELSKLTANAFLAQRISSINSISALCEAPRRTWTRWPTRSAPTAASARGS